MMNDSNFSGREKLPPCREEHLARHENSLEQFNTDDIRSMMDSIALLRSASQSIANAKYAVEQALTACDLSGEKSAHEWLDKAYGQIARTLCILQPLPDSLSHCIGAASAPADETVAAVNGEGLLDVKAHENMIIVKMPYPLRRAKSLQNFSGYPYRGALQKLLTDKLPLLPGGVDFHYCFCYVYAASCKRIVDLDNYNVKAIIDELSAALNTPDSGDRCSLQALSLVTDSILPAVYVLITTGHNGISAVTIRNALIKTYASQNSSR